MNASRMDSEQDFDRGESAARLRVPPQSVEAEQSVLGGLLLDGTAWDRIGDLLSQSDFYRHDHRLIFEAIGTLVNSMREADVITVYAFLQAAGKADDVGGMTYLNALAASVPSASNIRRYAEIVREKALQRALVAAADEAATLAFNAGLGQVQDAIERSITLFDTVQRRGVVQGPRRADQLAVQRIDHINDLATKDAPPAFSTGLTDLDRRLNGGLQPGRVYVLAARPSVGKTALALQIGLHQAKELGLGVLVLSQEMPAEEVTDRAFANLGGVDYGEIQRGQLSDMSWGRLSGAVETFGRLPVWIDDQAALTLNDIRSKAFALRRDGIKLLIVDYLQLCAGQSKSKNANRNTDLEEITRGLKALAKQMGIAILLLSQLSREVEKRGTPEPTLADLRDSGAIEQDADAVLGLWFARQWSDRKVMALTVLKNRQGERGMRIPLDFYGQFQQWTDSTADVDSIGKPAARGKSEDTFE